MSKELSEKLDKLSVAFLMLVNALRDNNSTVPDHVLGMIEKIITSQHGEKNG